MDLTQEAPKDSPLGRRVSRSLVKDWKSVQGDKQFNRCSMGWMGSVQGDKQFNRYSMGWMGRQKEMARTSSIESVLLIQPPLSSFLIRDHFLSIVSAYAFH